MFPIKHKLSCGLAAALFSLSAGCSFPTTDASTTFAVRQSAPTPHFAFLWSEQVTSWDYLSTEAAEFAPPSHVGATDELVVATSEGEVVKMQAANGKVIWRNRFEGSTYHAGAVIGSNLVFVADLEGRIRALDLNTGAQVWETRLKNSIETRGTFSEGRLFLSDSADVLWAFDAATGERIWTHSREVPEYFTVKGSCTPVPDGDVVYCGFSDGHLVALQVDSGELVWDADLTGGETAFVDVDDSVFVIGSRIYAISYAGGAYALDRDSGRIIWRQEVESAGDAAIGEGRLFIASATGRVSSFDLATGEPQWNFRLDRSLPGTVAMFGPYAMVFTTDGPVYVLDAATGYPHTKWRGPSGFLAGAERGSSRIYALSNYGRLFGMKLGY